jgi:hypothetical protein
LVLFFGGFYKRSTSRGVGCAGWMSRYCARTCVHYSVIIVTVQINGLVGEAWRVLRPFCTIFRIQEVAQQLPVLSENVREEV